MKSALWVKMIVMATTGVLFGGLVAFAWFRFRPAPAPADIAAMYARAVYAHDHETIWQLASEEDKQYKTREQYLADDSAYSGLRLDLARRLAEWIEFIPVSTAEQGGQIIVAAQMKVPDPSQPEIQAALAEADSGTANRQALLGRLQELHDEGRLKWVESNEAYTLVADRAGPRLSLHWSGAVVIHLEANLKDNLPFEFYPAESEISVSPGETRRTQYVMKNLSDHTITVKALHTVLPEAYKNYLTIIQCFCFTEHTLAPGETLEAPVILRVEFNVPTDVTEFTNRYDLYPLESFPTPTPVP
jgi:hypothetical protein